MSVLIMEYLEIITLLYLMTGCKGENKLIKASTNDCVCLDDVVTYECTVFGGTEGITVWKGDFFHCSTGKKVIELVHRQGDDFNSQTCNDGNVVGRIVRVENSSYISQLNVTLTYDIAGMSIECISDNGTDTERVDSLNLASVVNNFTCTDIIPTDDGLCGVSVQSVITCGGERQKIILTNCPGENGLRMLLLVTIPSLSLLILILAVLVPLLLYNIKKKSLTGLCSCQKCSHRNAAHKEQESDSHGRNSQVEDNMKAIKIFDNRLNGTYSDIQLDIQSEQETSERKTQDDNNTKAIRIFDNRLYGTYNLVELDIQNKQLQESTQGDSIQLTLNNLFITLQERVSSHWYQFGLALGVPKRVLEQLKDYLDEDALVEILDYWLKHHPFSQPKWQDVAAALKQAGFSDLNVK